MDITTIKLGDRVKVNEAFVSIPKGSTGVAVEFYHLAGHDGVMIKWDHDPTLKDGFSADECNRYLVWPQDEIRS